MMYSVTLTLQHRRRGVVVERHVFHQVFLGVQAGQRRSHQHRLAGARSPYQHDRTPPSQEPLQEVAHSDGLARVHQAGLEREQDECVGGLWEKQMLAECSGAFQARESLWGRGAHYPREEGPPNTQ